MYSKVFDIEHSIQLDKIYRQDSESGLNKILPILRNDTILKFEDISGTNGSIYTYDGVKDFLKEAIKSYKIAMGNSDILHTKVLAYTNNRVNALSDKIQESLFGKELPYNKFQFLTSNENFDFGDVKFWNSMDYIITEDVSKSNIHIPMFMTLPGYKVQLYDSSSKNTHYVSILDSEISPEYLNSLTHLIESIRLDAIYAKQRKDKKASGKLWGNYYKIINSFCSPTDLYYDGRLIKKKTFSSGYASTVHRSQGSSINNVFIDMKNILMCRDKEELRQLQYVGISRSNKNVHILQ